MLQSFCHASGMLETTLRNIVFLYQGRDNAREREGLMTNTLIFAHYEHRCTLQDSRRHRLQEGQYHSSSFPAQRFSRRDIRFLVRQMITLLTPGGHCAVHAAGKL